MCLGMHFAHMEIKAVLYQLLLTRTLTLSDSKALDLEYLPIVRPKREMRIVFQPLNRYPNIS